MSMEFGIRINPSGSGRSGHEPQGGSRRQQHQQSAQALGKHSSHGLPLGCRWFQVGFKSGKHAQKNSFHVRMSDWCKKGRMIVVQLRAFTDKAFVSAA